jgi:hypothetical protein
MVDVVLHERALGVRDGFFDRLQLLGDVQALAVLLSIISITLARCPCARRSRLTSAGWVECVECVCVCFMAFASSPPGYYIG